MEVSPLLANDSAGTTAAAAHIFEQAGRSNLFVKIPGTRPGLAAIEQSVFAGVPVNVTLLFSRGQYLAAADAYLRGIERRVQAGLDANVASVASLFVSRWDRATVDAAPQLRNRLGVAIASDVYHAYGELLSTPRWRQLAAHGARPQRLLWASTGTKGASERDTMYIEALAAPDTIITLPEKTLIAFADHGQSGYSTIADHAAAQETIQCFARAGVDVGTLALRLQIDGTRAFAKSWESLMQRVAAKRTAVPAAMCRP
jgi:transaldolase